MTVYIAENVEFSVVITDTGSPDALTVSLFPILKLKLVSHIETVHGIAAEPPVDKVLGMEHYHTGNAVHRGSGKIEVVTHTNDVRIGELIVEQRVGKRSVAVVSRPRLGRDGIDQHATHDNGYYDFQFHNNCKSD